MMIAAARAAPSNNIDFAFYLQILQRDCLVCQII